MINNIEQKICNAVDIIVQKALSEVQYNKTIQATILECIDSTIGKYKVRFQDSTFYAYSENTDTTYIKGASVYVMVPNDSDDKDRIILGAVKKLGINYVATIEGEDAYEINGKNCIDDNSTVFEMCSYKKDKYVNVLYHKDYSVSQNKININNISLNEYIKNSSSIICGMTVKTSLPREQQFRGNFGMIVALDFLDNTLSEEVTRIYTVDVDKMIGNPYKQIIETNQYGIFDIDNKNFLRVNYISLFCYDFPNSKEDDKLINDIFIKDIKLCGAGRLSEVDINNYSLTFLTPQGTYFDDSSEDIKGKTLIAQVRVKGKIIDNESQPLPYYWFTENVGVTSDSIYYNPYGGRGWKCLNNSNIIKKIDETDTQIVEWIPEGYKWNIVKSDIQAKEVRYKCVTVYDGTVISKIITIKNLSSEYDIKIQSDLGTQFYFDVGRPTLTCLVNGIENTAYTYSWAVTDNAGNFQQIVETTDLNQQYTDKLARLKELEKQIEEEIILYNAASTELKQLQEEVNNLSQSFRVDKFKLYNVKVNEITNYAIYQCSIHYGEKYLGTTQIVLNNSLEIKNTYNLIVNNGTYTYKYNENGISPANSTIDQPIKIQRLTFDIFDPNGEKITDKLNYPSIKWKVPIKNTMLKIPDSYKPSEIHLEDNYAIYSSDIDNKLLKDITYQIADRYDISKINNTIELQVTLPGNAEPLIAQTALTFIKEGEPGTNGTEFTCKIVPNVINNVIPPLYPMITQLSNGSWSLNYQTVNLNRFFRAQLWHNEEKIFDSVTSATSTEGKNVSVSWEILKNKYTSSIFDTTSLSVNAATGVFSYNGYKIDTPANIVKVTIGYDGVIYHATIPIITVRITDNNYRLQLKDYTGFRYAIYTADGRSPKYDNANPFEILVTRNVNNIIEDVSLLKTNEYKVEYNWNYLGRIYENNKWINTIYLSNRQIKDLEKNQKATKPADDYDGQCVTNAIECIVTHGGVEVGRIHLPIHLLLNKYGQSALNGWDGNSIDINNEGGFILAPQVGAGVKNNDNTFTGVLIGKVKEAGSIKEDIGLLGYANGVRSIFLDAATGKAEFGANNKGKIIIDPTSNKAQLYSGNYNTSAKTGLMIDLSTPEIRFGSGNFVVDASGHITAKGGGTIAGWQISDDALTSQDNKTIFYSSNNHNNERININKKFFVYSDGSFSAANKYFVVDKDGTVHATAGEIGGWNIDRTRIYSSKIELVKNGSIRQMDGHWSINQDGTAEFRNIIADRSGNIAGWTINSWGLSSGNIQIRSDGAIRSEGWWINNDGTAKFNDIVANNVWSFGSGSNTWSSTGFSFGSGFLGGNTVSGDFAFTNGSMKMGNASKGNIGIAVGKNGSSVKIAGDIYANNGYFKGEIHATSGYFNGELNATKFKFGSGDNYFEMGYETKYPYAGGLSVGTAGISVNGGIECNNIGKNNGTFTIAASRVDTKANWYFANSAIIHVGDRTLSEYVNDVVDANLGNYVTKGTYSGTINVLGGTCSITL